MIMAFVLKRVHINSTSNAIHRPAKILRLILYLSILLTVVLICEAKSTCTVNGINYICSNIVTRSDFPLELPSNVRKVTLMGTRELNDAFPNGLYNHITWANVSELSILKFTNIDIIEKSFLNGLEELKVISISYCTHLQIIDQDIFNYTPNIEELHFDGNTRLNLSRVEAALIDKLSNLRYLSLIGIQALERHLVLGDNFVKALHAKNLSCLDISGNNVIIVENAVVNDVLPNLKYLNVSYSQILAPSGLDNMAKSFFKTIELLDLTGVQYLFFEYTTQEERIIKGAENSHAMYFLMREMVNKHAKVIYNIRLRFETCDIKFPKMFDLSKNSLIHLNITFIGDCRLRELETMNLESNNMEYISPNFLSIFPSLKILDLSNNLLMKMEYVEEFSDMFIQNKDLEIVFLRNNRLTFVPSNLFLTNSKLSIIDMSENELAYLNLNLHRAENLTLINLRRNRLKTLSSSMMEQFESLLWKQNTESNHRTHVTNGLLKQFQDRSLIGKRYRYGFNASEDIQCEKSHFIIPLYVTTDILENRFVCDCDTLVFMEWILFTNIDIINKTEMSCKYGNTEVFLNIELFQTVETNCQLASSIGIGVASAIAIIISILTLAITIRQRCKSKRLNQDLEHLKQEILQENTHFEFLIFLSYCSRDAQIVYENILPSLNRYLHETFYTERDIVCTGENYFVPGMRIIEEIHRCIDKCLVVVPVITPEFLQSDWSQEECVAAVDRHRQVVILMKKHTDTSRAIVTIQNLIGQYTRGTWSDNEGVFVIRPSWNIICEGIVRAAIEAFRHYRIRNLIEPAEDNPLVEEIV
ncbi:hypothetical protein ACJMK2_000694 [Sinanodonta woodiana]|uniref:TIR domain-containing protein n=1 Tax=Sinanodonta woodiana TaxID=1069815 RepID=A0ABD3XQ16_SINWO